MNKFIWLVRREVWESRAIWIAPAICAAIMIFGTLIGAMKTGTVQIDPDMLGKINSELTPDKARGLIVVGLIGMSVPFLICALCTQYFYTLDALFAERRDRSVLFWRSLPVSDAATVASKAVVGALLIPLVAAAATLFTELVLCVIASVKAPDVLPLATYLWSPSVWAGWAVSLLFLTVAGGLWFLPAVGWNLLVSAWAPRSPFVYATMAPVAVMFAEKVVFGSHKFLQLIGAFYSGFGIHALGRGGAVMINLDGGKHLDVPASALDIVRPLEFFATPELWVYVALGAAMIAGAVWLRRYRDAV